MSPRTLRLLAASFLLWLLGFGLYDDLFPIYARGLGATAVQLGLLYTVRQMALTAGSIVGGFLSDRYSRRHVMIASWVLGAPAPLLFLLAPSWAWLVPGLLLYDFTAFGIPAYNAYVAGRAAPRRIASTFALLTAVASVGMLVGPAAGGLVAERFGIRTTFALAFVCFAASTGLVFLMEPDPARGPAAGGWREAFRLGDLRGLWGLLLLLGLASAVPLAVQPFVPTFLREVRGLSLAHIGLLRSAVSAGGLILAPLMGRLADRAGHRPALVLLFVLVAGAHGGVALAPVILLPAVFLLKSGAAIHSLSSAVVGAAVPAQAAGRAYGILGTLWGLFGAAGALPAGLAYRADPTLPLVLGAAGLAVAAGLAAWPQIPVSHHPPGGVR